MSSTRPHGPAPSTGAAPPTPGTGHVGEASSEPGHDWHVLDLAALCAAGVPPRALRALVARWPDPDEYRRAWSRSQEQMRADGHPDPDVPDVDLGDGWVLTPTRPGYPTQLLASASPAPFLLFGRGDRAALQVPGVAVVGTRTPSPFGMTVARTAAATAAALGANVVSGLARGIDATAHDAALHYGAKTVAVVATGPDIALLPAAGALAERIIESDGAVISEHPFRTGPDSAPGYRPAPLASRLVARNRIIVALSALTVPCEGSVTSGTMHAVWSGLRLGRPVVVALPAAGTGAGSASGAGTAAGQGLAAALAARRPLDVATLRAAGAPKEVAEAWAGRSPLASAAVRDPAELDLVIRTLWSLSPLHGTARSQPDRGDTGRAADPPVPAAA